MIPPRKPNPLSRLGMPPPKPGRSPAPVEVKSDPFPEAEPITENQNPAGRVARLVARWNNLSPDRQKLAEQYIAALETTQEREKAR